MIDYSFANLLKYFIKYLKSLFPIVTWITRYNLTWLTGDVIAGLTAGAVVIPQGLAYAKIASLPPEYGLYSSFVGVSIYCLFSTAKDVTIGPTVIMSLLISQAIGDIQTHTLKYSGPEIAATIALFAGIISLFLGVFRLGFIVNFIPAPVIAGFTTGSAFTIGISQLPKLFGITNVNTRQATYLVLIDTLKSLPKMKIDTVLGVFGLIYLYGIKFGTKYLTKRYPLKERLFFFIKIFRTISLVIICTFLAFLLNIGKDKSPIIILKNVPSGFNHVKSANTDLELIDYIKKFLPGIMIILILEHIAIAKCFGRINDYKINPSQELIAIGLTNSLGSFFGAYPTTGSFVRTAIKAKSGVRTPLAGIFSGILVILSLFVLTPAFYYIPDSTLAAVVIHAILDLMSGPKYVKKLWKIRYLDLIVFIVGVIITIFTTVEVGIYVSTGLALLILLLDSSQPKIGILDYTVNDSQEVITILPFKKRLEELKIIKSGILILRVNKSLNFSNSNLIIEKIIDYVRLFINISNNISNYNNNKKKNDNNNNNNNNFNNFNNFNYNINNSYWYQKIEKYEKVNDENGNNDNLNDYNDNDNDNDDKLNLNLNFLILDLSGISHNSIIDFVTLKSLLYLKEFLLYHSIELHFTNVFFNDKIRQILINERFKDYDNELLGDNRNGDNRNDDEESLVGFIVNKEGGSISSIKEGGGGSIKEGRGPIKEGSSTIKEGSSTIKEGNSTIKEGGSIKEESVKREGSIKEGSMSITKEESIREESIKEESTRKESIGEESITNEEYVKESIVENNINSKTFFHLTIDEALDRIFEAKQNK